MTASHAVSIPKVICATVLIRDHDMKSDSIEDLASKSVYGERIVFPNDESSLTYSNCYEYYKRRFCSVLCSGDGFLLLRLVLLSSGQSTIV